MFRSAVLEPSVAVEFGDVKLLSGRRMDCLDRELEAETRHDSTRPFVLGFVDADDLIEGTLLKPVVRSCPSGLGGVSATAERFAEPPPDLDRRQNLRKEPWHPQVSPAGELPRVTEHDRRQCGAVFGGSGDSVLNERCGLLARPSAAERIPPVSA